MRQPHGLSRRAVLAGGAGTLALLGLAPQFSTAGTPEPYSYAAWLPLLGRTVAADGGSVLRITKVEDLRRPALVGEMDSHADRFRIHFTLLAGSFVSETLTVIHPQAGPVGLFTTQSHATQSHATKNHTAQNHTAGSGTPEGLATAVACIDRRGASLLPPQN